jgi:transcriptional regulator with XRE-family HTH domain
MNTIQDEPTFAADLMTEPARKKHVETIAACLSKIRKDQGFTQAEVAHKLKTTQSVYSRYERGEIRLPADTLIQLAKILGATPNELCGVNSGGSTKKVNTSEENIPKRFLRRLRGVQNLTRTDQDYLLRTIDAFMGIGLEKQAKKTTAKAK